MAFFKSKLRQQDLFTFVPFALILFLFGFSFSLGWVALHTIFVKRIGVAFLPYTYIVLSLFGVLGSFLYLVLVNKVDRYRLLFSTVLLTSVVLVFSRGFIGNDFEGVPGFSKDLIYFAICVLFAQGCCGFTLNMQIWAIISDLFSPEQGKKIFPMFGIAYLFAGFFGGVIVPFFLSFLGVGNLIYLWSFFLFLSLPLIAFIPLIFKKQRHIQEKREVSLWEHFFEGFQFTFESAAAMLILGVATFFSIVSAFQDFQYTQVMNHAFKTETSLATFYAYYWVLFNLTGIVLQFLLTEKIVRFLGVINSVLILPVTIFIGLFVLSIYPSFYPAFFMRYSWDVVGIAIQGTAYQLLYGGVPAIFRGNVRGWVEGIVNPIGSIVGGGVLILIQTLLGTKTEELWMHISVFSSFGMVLSFLWFIWVFYHKKFYYEGVQKNLESSDVQTAVDAVESLEERANTYCFNVLVSFLQKQGVSSSLLRVKASAMHSLARMNNYHAIGAIIPFLHHNSSILKKEAIISLSEFSNLVKNPLVYNFVLKEIEQIFFSEEDFNTCVEAARFLMETPDQKVSEKFIEDVKNRDTETACKMILSIPYLKLSFPEIFLMEFLKYENSLVREKALIVLSHFGTCLGVVKSGIFSKLKSGSPEEYASALYIILCSGLEKEFPFRKGEVPESTFVALLETFLEGVLQSKEEKDKVVLCAKEVVRFLKESEFSTKEQEKIGVLFYLLDDFFIDKVLDELSHLNDQDFFVATHFFSHFVEEVNESFLEPKVQDKQ